MATMEDYKLVTMTQLAQLNDTIAPTPANSIRIDEIGLDCQNIQFQYKTAVGRLSRPARVHKIRQRPMRGIHRTWLTLGERLL